MKQKRKVKNLVKRNSLCNMSALTSVLFWFGVTFCVFSAVLLSVSISEAAGLQFNGLSDKTLKLYHLNMVNPNDVATTEAEMYIDNNSTFHITPAPIITNISGSTDNKVDDGLYSNVLGGKIQEIHSNNVTLIGGMKNFVVAGNDNATILGGVEHTYGASNGTPMVVVGGRANIMHSNHDGNVLIGGYNNEIGGNVNNGVILGGTNNTVSKNSGIVGGKNVKLNKENVFAYSNSSSNFEPKTENAFYLNLDGGVGINADSSKKGVSVNGVVDFGDIQGHTCTSDNIGELGAFNGCLIGCTEVSKNQGGKWEMLDRGKDCEYKCSLSNACYFQPESPEIPAPDYTSFCTAKTVDRAHMCNNVTNLYKNVVFESKLIDSETPCPAEHDKCIFQCNSGSHLFIERGKPVCKLDCVLPWSSTGAMIKHGVTTEGYKAGEVSCSNDDGRNITDSCVNYKKTLTCNDGTLNGLGNIPGGYTYGSCTLTNYTCNTDEYNLTRSTISSIAKDTISSWNDTDRGEESTLQSHGVYKLCKDYTSNGYDGCTAANRHYKLVRCKNGYSTGALHPYECRAKCKLGSSYYDDGREILGYKATSATCPGVCESTKLTCNNGNWIGDSTTYSKESCNLSYPSCPSSYDVDSKTVLANRDFSIYNEGCQVYRTNGNKHCVKQDIVFDLIGCIDGYHTESGNPVKNKYCIPNSKQVYCKEQGAPRYNATYNKYKVTVNWIGEWNNGHWETEENCTWYCNNGYHLETEGYSAPGACLPNSKVVQCDNGGYIPAHASFTIRNITINWIGQWNVGRWEDRSACDWSCNPGYCGSSCQYTYQTCSKDGKPDHSSYIVTTICGGGSCDWSCDSGYHYSNGGCEPDCPSTAKFGEYCCSTTTCVDSQGDSGAPHRFCYNNRCVECSTPGKDTCTRSDTTSTCCTAEGECTYGHSFCS